MKYSKAPFKMVATGGQVLNTAAVFENYATIPDERAELLRRIDEEGITGVVFLTGDRHFTELSQMSLKDGRTILDLTVSPLTSGTFPPKEENLHRVDGTVVGVQNFATLDFTGKRDERVMTIRVHDAQGVLQWERAIPQHRP
jgi:alkaline phosphatase D